jgi:hypothetical protein
MEFNDNEGNGFPDPTITPEDNAPDVMPNAVDLNKNDLHIQTGDPYNYDPTKQPATPQSAPYSQPAQTGYQPASNNPQAGYSQQSYSQSPQDGRLPYSGNNNGAPYRPYANGEPYRNYPTGLATASLVIGIVSIVFGIIIAIFVIPLGILPVIGLILGIVYKTKKYPVKRGVSTAGIICNVIGILLPIITYVLIFTVGMNILQNLDEYLTPEEYEMVQEEMDRQLDEMYGDNPELRQQMEDELNRLLGE